MVEISDNDYLNLSFLKRKLKFHIKEMIILGDEGHKTHQSKSEQRQTQNVSQGIWGVKHAERGKKKESFSRKSR